MPAETRRKRTRDNDRDSRKAKKKKRHSTDKKDRAADKDDVVSGAEEEVTKKMPALEKSVPRSAPVKKETNGKSAKANATDGKEAPKLAAEEDFMADLIRSDWEDEPGSPAGTPPPSPGSRYQGTPSPPPPDFNSRKPRQFVIEYKGRVPTHDPNRRIIGLESKKKKKKKKSKPKAKAKVPKSSADIPLLTGATDPKSIRMNAMMTLNTMRNKFGTNDFQASLASLENRFQTQNTWQAAKKEKTIMHDKHLVYKPAGERRKRTTALQLVDQGTFVAEARILRKEAEEKQLSKQVENKAKRARKSDTATTEEQEASELVLKELTAIPLVEWWDRPMVTRTEMGYESQIDTKRITSHVQHPEVVRPDRLKPVNVPLPFYLTRAERRKKRRQIRKHKHETLTDEIRLGLREPPEPKLNLENIVRVLGSQAIQDPTCAEAKARASMLKRKMEHELHNEKRRLSGHEKRDKKRAKLKEDTSKEVHVALYRVSDLSDGKKRYKVDINASQYNLTGRCIRIKGADVNMVVVEGGPKGIAKYDRLMMRRIRWGDDLMNASEANNRKYCAKVWQGVNRKRNFTEFQMKLFPQPKEARKHLDEFQAAHYWDQIETHGAVETF